MGLSLNVRAGGGPPLLSRGKDGGAFLEEQRLSEGSFMANRIAGITGMQIALISALVLIAATVPAGPLPRATATGKTASAPTPTPPQKRGDRPASGSASSPALASAPVSPAPVFNTPQHSPDQIDFGGVSDGSSARKTFSLTTNGSGYVAVAIPAGPFHLVEFREVGPAQGGSKGPSGQYPAVVSGVRSRIRYQENQTGPFQWSMAPNTEMQIDIIFAPKVQGGTIGLKAATMNVTGPGPRGNWALSIPLRGVLNELKLGPPERVPPRAGRGTGASSWFGCKPTKEAVQ
jgi:hypothetical protein